MKPNVKFLLATLFILSSFFLQAAHIIGGEMTYRCLGNGDYEITLIVYRDCEGLGATFDGPANGAMSIYRTDSSEEFARITMPNPIINEVTLISNNPCLIIPPIICVQQGVYKFNLSDLDIGNINLPISDESYFIVYQRCCRNNTITNIINPDETGTTIFQEITAEAQMVCNNTPTFDMLAPIVLCVNEPFIFDHSATDIDGDSLLYEFCSPLKGGGVAGWTTPGNASDFDGTNPNPDAPPPYINVDWMLPSFNSDNPMGGDPMVMINEETGVLSGTPNTSGQFVVGICVTEFRNGSILSVVQRDLHINVQACSPADLSAAFEVNPDSDGLFHFINNTINGNSFLWDFGDGNTSDLENPSHTYDSAGTYTVTLTVFNDLCDLTDQITQEVDFITSLEDLKNTFEVQIFPNPNGGNFNLKIENENVQDFQIKLLDLYGKELLDFSKKFSQGAMLEQIQIDNLSKGVYYLKIKNSSKLIVKRVVVQ